MTTRNEIERNPEVCEKQIVYVLRETDASTGQGEIEFTRLVAEIWRRRWFVVAMTALFAVASIVYSLTATPYYRAEAVLLQRAGESGLSATLSQFGGLADLAGISAGGASKEEPLAVLRSRGFAQRFITRNNLMEELAPRDGVLFRSSKASDARDKPDIRMIADAFMRRVMMVEEDKKTGLLKIAIEWKDAAAAARWANDLALQLNQELQARAIEESARNIRYLREQLESTSTVSLQQSISRLLESELQKAMLAGRSEEYVFRVIDAAEPPVLRARPKRTAIVLLAVAVGFFLSAGAAAVMGSVAQGRRDPASA